MKTTDLDAGAGHPPASAPREPEPASPPAPWAMGLTLVLAGLVVFHFAVIWLYLVPTNPIKMALFRPVNEYVSPLFIQNWQLFAPTPISIDEIMMVKFRWREHRTGKRWESDWVDITSPVHNAIHATRIGPYSKLSRPHTGLWEQYGKGDPLMQSIRAAAAEAAARRDTANVRSLSDSAVRRIMRDANRLTSPERLQRGIARAAMYRLAASYVNRIMGADGELLELNVRYMMREFPRFSQRTQSNATSKTYYMRPLGWSRPPANVAELPRLVTGDE